MKKQFKVLGILAEASGECTFDLIEVKLSNPQKKTITSTKIVVQSTLITAFFTNSSFVPALYDKTYNVFLPVFQIFFQGVFTVNGAANLNNNINTTLMLKLTEKKLYMLKIGEEQQAKKPKQSYI